MLLIKKLVSALSCLIQHNPKVPLYASKTFNTSRMAILKLYSNKYLIFCQQGFLTYLKCKIIRYRY